MITNLPPPGGVSPVVSSDTSLPPTQDSFSYEADEYPQGYPNYPNQHYQHQYYPQQQPQQYPTPQVPHWHHQHGYYNPYPQQQQTYPSYSPSDPNGYGYLQQQSNGYYDHSNGVHQSTQNCTPSPLANSDDSGEGCINESKAGSLRGGLLPLIPRPKGPKPTTSVMSAKRGGKRARQRDPNEPQKPVSAYALFFRDVQAGIKQRNPAASFGEVSKHVAALWDGMDPDSKGAYKRRTEQAKKEYLRQLAAYRATLVSKGNTLESPYNGKGLDIKVGDDRSYLMNPRMSESSGYGSTNSSGNSLTPLGTVPIPTSTSPQATLGQSPANNGYTQQQQPPSSSAPQPPQQQHHMRQQHPAHMPPDARFPGGFAPPDPYSQHPDHEALAPGQVLVSHCKRPGCPNPVRMMSNRPMPEYCSNDCLVSESNKAMTNNPYSNATANWQQQQQEQVKPPGSSPNSEK